MEDYNLIDYKIVTTKVSEPWIKITNSIDSYNVLKPHFDECMLVQEKFGVLLLNSQNDVIGFRTISLGAINQALVDTRILFKYVVDSLATGIIVCHNHPSGYLKPSPDDYESTRKIQSACDLFAVRLVDHIILTDIYYYSFKDNGDI